MGKKIRGLVIGMFMFYGNLLLAQTIIHLKKTGGVYSVPCLLNGVKLEFIFDTGASDVSISLTEANFLFKNGFINKDDIIGSASFLDASGNINKGTKVNVRKLEFSNITLNNVEATVVHQLNAPLLLGQSAMSKLGKFTFDPNTGSLSILQNNNNLQKKEILAEKIYEEGVNNFNNQFFEEAINNFTDVINIDSNHYNAYIYRALSKEEIGDHLGAKKDNTIAISIDQYNALGYANRFINERNLKEKENACSDFYKACNLGFKFATKFKQYCSN